MNYDFVQKEHWRNRMWNQIRERVTCHPRDAVVIYLAAEQDLDRETAIRKGFSDENLIAVDYKESVVSAIRARGRLAICGNLFDVLDRWPDHTPVDAVVADFTCGLRKNIIFGMAVAMNLPAFANTTFLVNLMRGRDAETNDLRADLSLEENKTSRAKQFALTAIPLGIAQGGGVAEFTWDGTLWLSDEAKRRLRGMYLEYALRYVNADIGTYQSSKKMYFDWCIWTNRFSEHARISPHRAGSEEIKGSISAILAHRTRRLAA
jgi:hypothetical protein